MAKGRRLAATVAVDNGAARHPMVTTLALSFDHHIVDGDLGSRVLRDMLEDPLRMLTWS